MLKDHDVAVVGAGIIGLAVAREILARRPRLRVAVLDKQGEVGFHQTGHNSGVIHAGIYYAPGSLKARLCVEGARRLYEWCDEHGVAYERCGKVIVATGAPELARLDELERRGRANGVPGLRRLDAEGLREVEPHCVGVAALHSPNTGIVDFPGVARSLARDVEERGGRLLLGHEVLDAQRDGAGVVLATSAGRVRAGNAIFCAGPWADRLAVRLGAPADPRIVPFRGAYLKLRPEARRLVKGLIYPVPDPELPFLGVHLTKHISGEVWLGPSALLVGARDAYRLRRVRARDVAETLRWPGTWRVMRRWWRTGLGEIRLAASRRAFVAACRAYVPDLTVRDVARESTAGVRAQAVGRDGRLVDDFLVGEAGGVLHVRNAPSPAATSSLALAELIAERAGF
ncbi:MAG TPA: L-2-hydroxyglutarate oxidase [Solirubrobacteraceae bacterium]|nr:L-2-hydroxyglutarate oxidase [Solirubrobacteraceae bacterium]